MTFSSRGLQRASENESESVFTCAHASESRFVLFRDCLFMPCGGQCQLMVMPSLTASRARRYTGRWREKNEGIQQGCGNVVVGRLVIGVVSKSKKESIVDDRNARTAVFSKAYHYFK